MSKFYANEERNLYPEIQRDNPSQIKKQQQPSEKDIFSKYKENDRDKRNLRDSVFLKQDEQDKEDDKNCCQRCCSCLNLDYYKDFFKVTNKIVLDRIKCNLKFWSGGFFEDLKADYDLYGPIWIYTTLVFLCSAVHNVLIYQSNSTAFEYEFKVIGISFAIFYILGLVLSAVYGLIMGCMGLNCRTSHIVCLYGYSNSNYIICVLLCIINMPLTTWLFLIYGGATKVFFILKNIFEKLDVPTSKKVIILVMVGAQAFVQLMAIKFALIVNRDGTSLNAVHFDTTHEASAGFLHFRTYGPHV